MKNEDVSKEYASRNYKNGLNARQNDAEYQSWRNAFQDGCTMQSESAKLLAQRKKYALAKALEVPIAIGAVGLMILVAVATTHYLSVVLGKAVDWVVFMGVAVFAVAFTVLWQAIDTYRKAIAESRDTTKGGR